MTFGLNREERNLLTYAGIDGNNKVFTAMNCFMPSKQCRAYHWALTSAARYLFTDRVLQFNRCIASDAEPALFKPIQCAMRTQTYLQQSKH